MANSNSIARSSARMVLPSRGTMQRTLRLVALGASGVFLGGLWVAGSHLWRSHQLLMGVTAPSADSRSASSALVPVVDETLVQPLLSGGDVRFGEFLERTVHTLGPRDPEPPAFPLQRTPELPAVTAPVRATPARQVRGDFVPRPTDAA